VQERSFKFLESSAPSGAWLLKSRLTFCWLRDTSEQRRLREWSDLIRRSGKCRQHLGFVLCKEFHHRLSTLGAADEELVAHGFDAKSDFLGAMQER